MPDDKKPSDKKKIKIKSQPAGFNPLLEPAKAFLFRNIGDVARDRLVKNIMPWNYDDPQAGSAFKRGIETVVKNKKEQSRAEKEQYIEKGYGEIATPEDKLRLDLLSAYGGMVPKYDMTRASKYKPSLSKNKDAKYIDSEVIAPGFLTKLKDEVKTTIGSDIPAIRSKKDIENMLSTLATKSGTDFFDRDEKGNVKVGDTGGLKARVTGLGIANIAAGEDEKGPYLSYYDIWDLDPNEGAFKSSKEKPSEYFRSPSGAGKAIIAEGATPPEVYGRIYFDKKTGKPIL